MNFGLMLPNKVHPYGDPQLLVDLAVRVDGLDGRRGMRVGDEARMNRSVD